MEAVEAVRRISAQLFVVCFLLGGWWWSADLDFIVLCVCAL